MVAFGTSPPPPELASISNPFRNLDFSDLPVVQRLDVAGGTPIAFRTYGAELSNIVIAIHGSTASSRSLHPLARALAGDGIAVYAPDIRGHGDTGRRGDIDRMGQLDEDLAALVAHVRLRHVGARLMLLGFSAGGGFVLKTAAGANSPLFDHFVMLAPALGAGAPTTRLKDDPWARPHIPRFIAPSILNRFGIHVFDGLEAIAYAVPPNSAAAQTAAYSHRLAARPHPDRLRC